MTSLCQVTPATSSDLHDRLCFNSTVESRISWVVLGRPLKGDPSEPNPTCGSLKGDLIERVYIPKGPPTPISQDLFNPLQIPQNPLKSVTTHRLHIVFPFLWLMLFEVYKEVTERAE